VVLRSFLALKNGAVHFFENQKGFRLIPSLFFALFRPMAKAKTNTKIKANGTGRAKPLAKTPKRPIQKSKSRPQITSRKIPLKTKSFGFEWVFDEWRDELSFYSKRMFGGLAGCLNGKMNLLLVESEGERKWQGKDYDFDLWNGLLICTSREFHSSLQAEFPSLISHPVLGKWLFLKANEADFENTALGLSELVLKNDPRMGIWPSSKNKKPSSKRSKVKKVQLKKLEPKSPVPKKR
jgi:hypothetical protein